MRAARFLGEGRIEITDQPMPTPTSGEVLLKVAYCGLCGSDRRPYREGFPLIPGHEVSGTVVDANGCNIAVGTEAVAYLSVYCGDCTYCRRGLTNLCLHRQGLLGWSAPWNGGYAEYMAVPAKDIVPLDPAISLDVAVLLLDTIGTAWHSLRLAQVTESSRVLVMGCGPLGLGAVAGLQAFGVKDYFASDLVATRRAAAEEFGARAVMPDEVREIEDLDVIIEAVGHPALINEAVQVIAPQGTVVMLGEAWQPWHFQPTGDSMLKDYALIRSWYFPLSEFAENQRMLVDGMVDGKRLISHTFDLEALPEAFRHFLSGETRKVLAKS